MIALIIAALLVAAGVYALGKYSGTNAALTSVAAEITKLETEGVTDVKAAIARIKAVL
jgi:hypothetical protein